MILTVGILIFTAGLLFNRYTTLNKSIIRIVFIVDYLVLGGSVVLKAVKNILKGQIFDENFLMSIATIGAFMIGDFVEAVEVMLFYQVGELFQSIAVNRSKKSIIDLMDIRPDFANLEINSELKKVNPETVL